MTLPAAINPADNGVSIMMLVESVNAGVGVGTAIGALSSGGDEVLRLYGGDESVEDWHVTVGGGAATDTGAPTEAQAQTVVITWDGNSDSAKFYMAGALIDGAMTANAVGGADDYWAKITFFNRATPGDTATDNYQGVSVFHCVYDREITAAEVVEITDIAEYWVANGEAP